MTTNLTDYLHQKIKSVHVKGAEARINFTGDRDLLIVNDGSYNVSMFIDELFYATESRDVPSFGNIETLVGKAITR